MNTWNAVTHYAGFDWARDHHAVVLINAAGQILSEFEFDHTPEGWKVFEQKTAPYPNLAIAIETSQGAAVDQLLQRQLRVYPVNPLAAQSYRRLSGLEHRSPSTSAEGNPAVGQPAFRVVEQKGRQAEELTAFPASPAQSSTAATASHTGRRTPRTYARQPVGVCRNSMLGWLVIRTPWAT